MAGASQEVDRRARMGLATRGLPLRAPGERVKDFGEILGARDEEWARYEASRCIHCPPPAPCSKACPLGNDIPEAMWLIEQGKFAEAAELYRRTSSMPEVCGRVCPHESLCQGACPRARRGEPVLTGALEAFAADWQRRNRAVEVPRGAPTGKRVAVIGSGPAGLACAEQLVQRGHEVVVFEARAAPGGLLAYGIPGFKMSNDVVRARIGDLARAGVEFRLGVRVGDGLPLDVLLNDGFHAVFVGAGAGVESTLGIPGVDLPGVHRSIDFLSRANAAMALLPEGLSRKPIMGKRVAVFGGGDTASDCLRAALRLGAEKVTCVYRRTEAEMPGSKKDRALAREEGAGFVFLAAPVRFVAGPEGRLASVECQRMEQGEPDASGRRRPVPVAGSEFAIEADTAVLALGFRPDPAIPRALPGLKTADGGLLIVDAETGATSLARVFAGGDNVNGPDLVVNAVKAGRKAAAAIDAFLKSA